MNPQAIKLDCLLKHVNAGLQQGPAGRTGNQGESGKLFLLFLDQTLDAAKKGFSPKERQGAKGAKTERDWLDLLRNQLLSAGLALKDISLSGKASSGLEKLLLAEGLPQSDVKAFLKRLFGGDSGREIKITELFEKLADLRRMCEKKTSDPVLEVSALPYLETLLRCLGLDVQQAKKVIGQARVDGGGLSLKDLIQNLKGIAEELPRGTKQFDQQSSEEIKGMLARMGLTKEAARIDGPVSLERFVRIIEEKIAGLLPQRLSQDQVESQVKGLLANVLLASNEKGPKFTLERRYSHKLKGLPHDGLKGNGSRAAEPTEETWKEVASQLNKPAVKGDGPAELQSERDKFFRSMRGLVDAVRSEPSEKTPEQKSGIAALPGREAIMGRAPVSQTVAGQGPRVIPMHVVGQVGRQLGLALKRGDNQVRVQLKPPHLGSIQLEMTLKENVLKVAMIAEHHSVKEILMSHVHELRDALVEQGVELQKIDVEIKHNFGHSMANAQRDLHGAQSRRHNPASSFGESEGEAVIADAAGHMRGNALLDMFA
ncbi:MAG: flagellar hook-length control protein FliK [Proteobacteria bacterium]|nr:flagellar hook-length control protein FliK [Pseudomonadota bacterium]